jgi:hypothetical protein
LAIVNNGHVLTLDNAANLGLETHVQHAISLVKNEVFDVSQGDTATLNQINQATGGGNEEVATTLDLTKLGADVCTTVHDAGANPRAVSEFAGLLEDLRDQLTSGSKNEGGRVSLALAAVAELTTTALDRGGRGTVLESLREDREKETTSLSGTGLGTGHKITAVHDDGDRVLLDRSRNDIAGKLDVGNQVVVQRRVGELGDRLRDIISGGLNGNIIVVGEVDSSLLLRGVVGHSEQLALQASIGGTRNVLAVAPLAIA